MILLRKIWAGWRRDMARWSAARWAYEVIATVCVILFALTVGMML